MFDGLIEKPKPRRWRTAVIVGSAVAHAGVIAGVAIAAMWHVEKLDVGSTVDITYRVPQPQGSSSPPPAAKLDVMKVSVAKPKIKPPPIHQPMIVKDPVPVTTGTSTTTDAAKTGGGGGTGTDPDADPTSTGNCTTPGACTGLDLDTPTVVEKKEDEDLEPPPIVEPKLARGLRISGNEQIHPPEMVRVDMMHQGKSQLTATVQLCVDTDGRVDQIRMLRSSGFQDYDAKLLGEIRNWRYRPYRVNGKVSGMCTVSIFMYRMTK